MFERYTEKARRMIFFARYEASQLGSPYIETEHLLLGFLREDKTLTSQILHGPDSVQSVRREIEAKTTIRENGEAPVDIPLSNESKRALAYGAEEAERLSHKHIGTEHLLLGLLREEKCLAAQILHERGVRVTLVRELLHRHAGPSEDASGSGPSLPQFTVDLMQKAAGGQLGPLIGREDELGRLIQVLGRASKKNAVLLGGRGVGRTTIVHGLARQIAEQNVPAFLQERKILALDLAGMSTSRRYPMRDFIQGPIAEFMASPQTIFFIDELHSLLTAPPKEAWLAPAEIVKSALLEGRVQCISLATPEESRMALERHPWLDRCFTAVEVSEPGEQEAVAVLQALKEGFEKHHSVSYSDEVIHQAVRYAKLCIRDRFLPDKAVDLIDEAGSFVKAKTVDVPGAILEWRKKVRLIVKHMENAIANHQFEKARFYSDEEHKARMELDALCAKHNLAQSAPTAVTREALEEAVAHWTGQNVEDIRKAVEQESPSPE